ncbi:hypothetical protein AOLI_G00202930 [Acnodon oligacanthus]
MAEARRALSREDELPIYLARSGTADQVARQKHGGLFCSVEGAYESKTIDFDALSVGQRGSRTLRGKKGVDTETPSSLNGGHEFKKATELKHDVDKELLENISNDKVYAQFSTHRRLQTRLFTSSVHAKRSRTPV